MVCPDSVPKLLVFGVAARSLSVFKVTHSCGDGLSAGAFCSLTVTFTPEIAGTRVGAITVVSNAAGSPHSLTVSGVGVSINAPVCTLTATPPLIRKNGASTLTASCSPAASSYVWTGGNCSGTTAATCVATPGITTAYSVTGANSYGSGSPASAQVTVKNIDLTPILMLLLD